MNGQNGQLQKAPTNPVAVHADDQTRSDARNLLAIALDEQAEFQKLYARTENNVRVFVERTNYELAALARVIQQKQENIDTLKKMVQGYFVAPSPPVISVAENQTPATVPAPPEAPASTPAAKQSDGETAP